MLRQLAGALALCLVWTQSDAALLGRAPVTPGGTDYQAYYDTVLRVTWLADANLPASNTFGVTGICTGPVLPIGCPDPPGAMDWDTGFSWIAAMNAAGYLGVNNWRLPSADVNGDQTVRDCRLVSEVFCRDNEMGYMYWRNHVQTSAPAPFSNIADNFGFGYYGSGTEYAADPSRRWFFNFGVVILDPQLNPKSAPMYAWPVSPGDLFAVPLPPAFWLLGSALGLLGGASALWGWISRQPFPGSSK